MQTLNFNNHIYQSLKTKDQGRQNQMKKRGKLIQEVIQTHTHTHTQIVLNGLFFDLFVFDLFSFGQHGCRRGAIPPRCGGVG